MSDTNYVPWDALTSATDDYNLTAYITKQMLGKISTATLVKVMAVNPAGVQKMTDKIGTVDVMPLVNQVDGVGNVTKHLTVYGLPYSRLQGGINAIVYDPKVGDIGIAVFASRDLSSVKATQAQANPGSSRRFSMADGMYVGGYLNQAPKRYIQFTDTGINIIGPDNLTVNVQGNVSVTASGSIAINSGGANIVDINS